MASPYQQQALTRKIIYIAIILVLAFGTYLLREFPGWGNYMSKPSAWGSGRELLEDVQLTDSMVRPYPRPARVGSPSAASGLAVPKRNRRKHHEWNELEVCSSISSIKLQPHFVTPWLFQSWNLAYNVSVESDRVKDKYFYIARGINLIAEGSRINRLSPDMRYTVGFSQPSTRSG